MAIKIIDSTDPGVVVRESTVHLSDEKLKNVLLRTYERAQQDRDIIKLHRFYSVFLSIAGTLFLSLLTSDFHSIGPFSAGFVTGFAWFVCAGSAIGGFILMAVHFSCKSKNDTVSRDAAVNEIFDHNFTEK